jgi:hypothetical protein
MYASDNKWRGSEGRGEPANAGEPWTGVDIEDLTDSVNRGDDIREIALFLCRREDEVRAKMSELGLVERPRPKKRR